MEISLTTPALLFSAISLLLLAYTNRFLAMANLIRNLHEKYENEPNKILIEQIKNLRKRVYLTRNMQFLGVFSLLLCVTSMFALFWEQMIIGQWLFGISLVLLMLSLSLSVIEIQISVKALNIQIGNMEKRK
ncbi:DUF2721 domain-containing protein [Bernardetia sp. ABR2-2B]|uniref:DUF2721 domain-containing protein n=1 Tax=Bernardetia sp. ABR2-2B TaxID=3127472 RepID=UPI0030CE9C75